MVHDPAKLTGYRHAADPGTPKGDCEYSRKTPLNTHDCVHTERARQWKPMWFPGETFSTFPACNCQDDMARCPLYKTATRG